MNIRAVLTVCAKTLQLLKGHVSILRGRLTVSSLEAFGMHLALEVVRRWTETRYTVVIIRKIMSGACLSLRSRANVREGGRRVGSQLA